MEQMKPQDIRVGANMCTSKFEYDRDPARWEHYAEIELRERIAHFIQKEQSEKIVTDNMVEKRIDLYVASPDVFWNIVQKEAEKIAFKFI